VGGFRTGKWLVARGLWRHRNTSFYALAMRPTYIPHPTSHTLSTTYHAPRTTYSSLIPLPTSHTLPPTSRQTTPLRPAATSPGGGDKTSKRLVARSLWRHHGGQPRMTHSIQATHHALRTTYHVQFAYPTFYKPQPTTYLLPTTTYRFPPDFVNNVLESYN